MHPLIIRFQILYPLTQQLVTYKPEVGLAEVHHQCADLILSAIGRIHVEQVSSILQDATVVKRTGSVVANRSIRPLGIALKQHHEPSLRQVIVRRARRKRVDVHGRSVVTKAARVKVGSRLNLKVILVAALVFAIDVENDAARTRRTVQVALRLALGKHQRRNPRELAKDVLRKRQLVAECGPHERVVNQAKARKPLAVTHTVALAVSPPASFAAVPSAAPALAHSLALCPLTLRAVAIVPASNLITHRALPSPS